ncbi:MAG: DNA/RNA non-specific endonuclease [Conexibacter sp.]
MGPVAAGEHESQFESAARRVEARTEARERNAALLQQEGGIAIANGPDFVVRRLDRLTRYYAGERLPSLPSELPVAPLEEIAADALARARSAELPGTEATAAGSSVEQAGAVLEAIVGSRDFLDASFLDAGVAAARAVGRIDVRTPQGRGFGTGSLVSSRLVLTNHHVLSRAEDAATSAIEFNFQLGLDGQPLQVARFAFDPDAFFLADEARDFALVAVRAAESELAPFGLNRVVQADGKAGIGDFVTIVQHPAGRMKEVALRENRVVDELEDVLHYAADTEPGSSGSPVFNDQWEIVALHHASVPDPGHAELGGRVNEGIRISRIAAFVRAQQYPPAQQALVDQLGGWERIVVNVGTGPAAAPASSAETESVHVDPDYANRSGYDPAFLGEGAAVPLPQLPPELLADAVRMTDAGGSQDGHVLPYKLFSVVMCKPRRLAYFTAVNVDGARKQDIGDRTNDRWFFDPRIAEADQAGKQIYQDNPLDKGHLVRRLDAAWGTTAAEAKAASDDTFHWTNCTPQHAEFNERAALWAGLEDYVLKNAQANELKVNVFSGPVLAADDDAYRGIQLPRQFWKVVAIAKPDGTLSAAAYLLSQAQLISGLEVAAEFSYGEYKTFHVPIAHVEQLTRLSFGPLGAVDVLAGLEATGSAAVREVTDASQIVL